MKIQVGGDRLQTEAMAAYHEEFSTPEMRCEKPFSASPGWLEGFKDRNKIGYRAVTSVGQKVPENAKEISLDFFEQIDKLRKQSGGNFIVWNCDQMPLYFDLP